MTTKPLASLSLDLDNKWSYMKTHGDENWDTFPSYFETVIPRFLDFLAERKQKMTVFVVGQDAVLPENFEPLSWITQEDHEIGNHSFHHEPWLHLYTPDELELEFSRTEQAIMSTMGVKPVGFRGSGFSLSDEVLRTLIRRGYEYDCSTFPTFLGPVARAYYFMTASLSKKQKQERKALFGSVKDGLQSNKPFMWHEGNDKLIEIPVTTFPIFKVPIHVSYLIYLARFSRRIARAYFWSAIKLARMTGIGPSLLLHPLDFLGKEDDQDLSFFPGMDCSAEFKIELLDNIMNTLSKNFHVVPMREHAKSIKVAELKKRRVATAVRGARAASTAG